MTFKEQIVKDNRDIFINLEEFSDEHEINGKKMPCQIDDYEMIDRSRRYQYNRSLHGDGIYRNEVLIFVNSSDFGALPPTGRVLVLDGKRFTVADAANEDGIYAISLEANRT